MSASLVGSEMCIRDRAVTFDGAGPSLQFDDAGGAGAAIWTRQGARWGTAAAAAARADDCPNAV
eukprot:15166412-Alexandrium_andersonii.AAC.1